jgi:ribosome-associated translation inhibitor RaiA
MSAAPTVTITLRDAELQPEARLGIESRCRDLAQEFPETTRFEVSVTQDGDGHVVHAHVTGKDTDLAAHASHGDAARAADQALNTVAKQLRRGHDKRIFARRREGRQKPPKKA